MPKILITPLNACIQATNYVMAAGLEHVVDSMKSEATYWRFPGRWGVLRIATHKKGGGRNGYGNGPTISSITFHDAAAAPDGFLRLMPNAIEWTVAQSVGLYMIRAGHIASPHPVPETALKAAALSPLCLV